jgi:hypothetical protein
MDNTKDAGGGELMVGTKEMEEFRHHWGENEKRECSSILGITWKASKIQSAGLYPGVWVRKSGRSCIICISLVMQNLRTRL